MQSRRGFRQQALIQNNFVDNLNDMQYCLQLDASSPTVQGNTPRIVRTCSKLTAAVNGNNVITANDYGVLVHGEFRDRRCRS